MGTTVALGRDFDRHDEILGNDQVLILSHELWERRFGSNPNIVGAKINIKSSALRGHWHRSRWIPAPGRGLSLPRARRHGRCLDPVCFSENGPRSAFSQRHPGDWKEGVSQEQATAEMNRIARGPGQRIRRSRSGIGVAHLHEAAARGNRGGKRADAAGAAGLSGVRVVDRVRECRWPAAGSRHRAQPRYGSARGAGHASRARLIPAKLHRKHAAGAERGHRRTTVGDRRRSRAGENGRRDAAARPYDSRRSRDFCVHAGALHRHRDRVRSGARDHGVAWRFESRTT